MATLSPEDIDALPDRIGEMFAGKIIFVTGGTGFLGKVLVEKVLRRCPEVKNIILLVRPKKGKDPNERLVDMFKSELFEQVIALRGGAEKLMKQMSLVAGDVTELGLGLSQEDRKHLVEDTDYIIHGAATIRFDEELKKAVLLNARGTREVVALAKDCKKLKLFMHISTSYCHLHEKLLEERPYEPPADPHKIIACMEWMSDDTIATLTPKLLDKIPNSYAYTKALGEAIVVEAMGQIPAIILRPSIVIPIWQEPIPGWTDNINGPTGLLIGAGKGVLRTMYCQGNGYADYLPVDIFVNGLLVACYNYVVESATELTVYNFTSSAEIKVSWQEMIDTGREIINTKVPLNGVAWYPGGSMKNSRWHHNICVFFFHLLPALFVDMLLRLTGHEPVLMRVQRRINKGFEVFEYYANNQWDFKSDHIQETRKKLNARERRDYKIDGSGEHLALDTVKLSGLDINKYFEDCIRCARLYILKESEESLPAARRHMTVMWVVDKITRILFWSLIFWCFSGYLTSIINFVVGSEDTNTSSVKTASVPIRDL